MTSSDEMKRLMKEAIQEKEDEEDAPFFLICVALVVFMSIVLAIR